MVGFEHPVLVYEDPDGFVATMAPYVTGGIEAGEPVFIAARRDLIDALGRQVGEHAGVRLEDTDEWFPEPMPRLRAFHEHIVDTLASGAGRLRLGGEPVWPSGPAEYVVEWQRYESLLNEVLAPYPVSLVCFYDGRSLPADIIDTARQTHPTIGVGPAAEPSATFVGPSSFLDQRRVALAPPPADAERLAEVTDLSEARSFVDRRARSAGVAVGRLADVSLATGELIANAILHGGGPPSIAVWTASGHFFCEVTDAGRWSVEPFAGYRPPAAEARSGRGLWIARQCVDVLQIETGRRGSTVRFQVALAA